MPNLIFNESEIEASNESKVNKSGYAYVGRKYKGQEIIWIKTKDMI